MSPTLDPMAAAEQQIALEHQLREKVINEEFKIWKKTVPLLYNTIYTHSLKWPLLTIDFSPKYTVSDDKNSIFVQFVTGTNTSLREQDKVSIQSLRLPSTLAPDFSSFAVGDSIPIPLKNNDSSDLSAIRTWDHAGEVNRANFSPNGEQFITFDNKGVVHLYNNAQDTPVDFKYHTNEGYCLEWTSDTEFLSGANDCQIALWKASSPDSPIRKFNTHSAVINDLSYSKPTGVVFGSVADDSLTQIHDLRAPEESPAIQITERHLQNAIQFHPDINYLFATGGTDNVVNIYDARSPNGPLRQLYGHNDQIFGLRWDTFDPLLLYSWGLDKRVISWDLNYMAEDYSPPLADPQEPKKKYKHSEDPCLHFVHAGHTNRVNDFSVHPSIPQLFATVGDDTLLEIYQPKTISEGDEEEDEEDEEDDVDVDAAEEKKDEDDIDNDIDDTSGKNSESLNKEDGDEDDDNLLDAAGAAQENRRPSTTGQSGQMGINSQLPAEEENSNSDADMAD